MIATLRPMNLGEILDRTFQIYRSRILVFLVIGFAAPAATLVTLVLGQIESRMTLTSSTNEALSQVTYWMPRDWPASFIYFLGWPVVAYLTSCALNGQTPALNSAIGWCRDRWQSWLTISMILWVVCILLPDNVRRLLLASRVEDKLGFHLGYGLFSSPGSFLLGLFEWCMRYFLVFVVALSAPAWVVEQLGAVPSLRRGWTLVTGNWVRVLTAQVLRDLLSFILVTSTSLVLGLVLTIALNNSEARESAYQIRYKLIQIVVPVVSALLAALLPIAFTLIYYDQRIRREGYDVERMMESAGLTAPATLPVVGNPITPAAEEEAQA